MTKPNDIREMWQELHAQERFQPFYPSECIVRFVMTQFTKDHEARRQLRMLDLGCGAGRHTLLLSKQGFKTSATDISFPGLVVCRDRLSSRNLPASLICTGMHHLPFPSDFFDGVVSFGVVYYNDYAGLNRAINEIYRVLVPGGKVVVVTRTTRDHRYGKGDRLDRHSFVLDIDETNEKGMNGCFLNKADVKRVFHKFSSLTIDRSETTTNGWRLDSDWIVVATK